MGLKFFLARKFPKYFESKEVKHLKNLGVHFFEDNPENFIPLKKGLKRSISRELNSIEQILKREDP